MVYPNFEMRKRVYRCRYSHQTPLGLAFTDTKASGLVQTFRETQDISEGQATVIIVRSLRGSELWRLVDP